MNAFDTRMEHVLLLAEHESLVAVDRAALRRLGAGRVRLLSQGQEALRLLRDARAEFPPVGMLVCHERLADMSGLAFLQALRQDPALASLPLVLLTGHKESEIARKARAFGGCALLARPYTQDDAAAALQEATGKVGLIRVAPELSTEAFVEASVQVPAQVFRAAAVPEAPAASGTVADTRVVASAPQASVPLRAPARAGIPAGDGSLGSGAEAFFRRGLEIMRQGEDAPGARKALLRAYEMDPLHAEACLALSKNSKALGLEQESRTWLCRAGVACLRRHEPLRAHDIFSKLPRARGEGNPLLPEAITLLREGESRAAAFALLEAHALEPEQPLHALVSRATLFTDAPEEAMRSLCKALAGAGYNSTARGLQNRLLSSPLPREDSEAAGFWDRFPVLRDIVSVASFTFSAWKHAA